MAVAGGVLLAASLVASLAAAENSTLRSGTAKDSPVHLAWTKLANFCLSSDGNRIENGVKVHLWDCDQSFQSIGQNFFVDQQNRIRMHSNLEYCLVIDGDDFSNGSKIQLWKCDEKNERQRWFTNLVGQIVSYEQPGFCLVLDGNRAFNGAKIQLWTCTGDLDLKSWMKIVRAPLGRAFAVPNADRACEAPFEAVTTSQEACLQAAEALRPEQGCMWGKWKDVIAEDNKPSWPKGCYFYGACQGGCGLYWNPTGAGKSCPTEGDCMSISVICQLKI